MPSTHTGRARLVVTDRTFIGRFANRLYAMRKKNGLIVSQCAESIGVGASAWHHYEQGMRLPTLEGLTRMAKLFGCTTDELLGLK
jgi:transcriptional regulator with XRE-family HTH domain